MRPESLIAINLLFRTSRSISANWLGTGSSRPVYISSVTGTDADLIQLPGLFDQIRVKGSGKVGSGASVMEETTAPSAAFRTSIVNPSGNRLAKYDLPSSENEYKSIVGSSAFHHLRLQPGYKFLTLKRPLEGRDWGGHY